MAERIEGVLRDALRREGDRAVVGSYRPSLIPICLRRQWYIYRFGAGVDFERAGVFEIGNLFHGWAAEKLSESGEVNVVEVEKPFTLLFKHGGEWLRVSGRIDLVLRIDGRLYPVEVKSIARLPSKPLDHHVMQLQPYMVALGVEHGFLAYLDKHALQPRVFTVEFYQSLFENVLSRAETLHEALLSGKPPKPEPGWMCRYCEFAERCEG